MEILFHRYGSICEPDIIEAFRLLGITVIEEDAEIRHKSIDADTRIKLLAEAILTHSVSFVFSINYFPYISEICERLNVLYVCLSVDCPVLELFSSSIRNRCNRIFLFDYNQYLQIKDENPDCIFYLPLGTNTDRWDTVISSAPADGRFLYDISFVGSLYTEKSPYLSLPLSEFDRGFFDGLMEAQLQLSGLSLIEETLTPSLIATLKSAAMAKETSNAVGGTIFHTLPDAFTDTDHYVAVNYLLGMRISELERIRTLNALAKNFKVDIFTRSDTSPLQGIQCHDGVSTHIEMPMIFYRSKINLNITIRSIQTGLSQRVWDVLGCQGFLLSNYQAEIPEYLQIGTDLDCYETIGELKEKISFYLAHDDIRQEIAAHGYETVKTKHTCLNRVVTILNTIYPPNDGAN